MRRQPDHPIHELLAQRFSPCSFRSDPIPEPDLRSLFEAARWAPSANNEQPVRYIVATRDDSARFDALLSCIAEGNRPWARRAPVLALGVVRTLFHRGERSNRWASHDLGLATGALLVEASARGLYVHPMGGILPERARELYDIPEAYEAWTGLAIGRLGAPEDLPEPFAERDRQRSGRKPLPEVIFADRWGAAAPFVVSREE